MVAPAPSVLCVRWLTPHGAFTTVIEEGRVALDQASPWDLVVGWPVPENSWADVRIGHWADGVADRLAFGCLPGAALKGLGTFHLRCSVALDGPTWTSPLQTVVLEVTGESFVVRETHDGETFTLAMAMPWDLFVRWIADDGALFGDQVVDQLSIDGDVLTLSALDGARGVADLGADQGWAEAVVAWNRLWESADIRRQIEELLSRLLRQSWP